MAKAHSTYQHVTAASHRLALEALDDTLLRPLKSVPTVRGAAVAGWQTSTEVEGSAWRGQFAPNYRHNCRTRTDTLYPIQRINRYKNEKNFERPLGWEQGQESLWEYVTGIRREAKMRERQWLLGAVVVWLS